jgi:hypothetical protein
MEKAMKDSKARPTPTTVIAIVGLVVALGGWVNGCREIDQQRAALDQQREALDQQRDALRTERDALKTERSARQREIDLLQRQTAVAEAGLRAIVVPRQPTIQSYRVLPDGSSRMTVGLVNQSEGIALRGNISVAVLIDVIPGGILPFLDTPQVVEQRARLGGFAALRGGAVVAVTARVPRRVVRARTPKTGPFQFLLTYRTTTGRVSRTAWTVDALGAGANAQHVTFTFTLR